MRRLLPTHKTRSARKRAAFFLAAVASLAVWPLPTHSQVNDAISREVTLLNDLTDRYAVTDVVSREVSLLNDLEDQFAITDVVSREVSFFNDLGNHFAVADVVSREVSLLNDLILRYEQRDAVSREVSFDNMIHCSGDFNGDFAVNTQDIHDFVFVLIHVSPHPAWIDAADLNCDGLADGRDIKPFVDDVLAP